MSEITVLFLLATLGSVAGLIGGAIFLLKKEWAKGLASRALPLAAGVLLAVSFLELLPEAVEQVGETAFVTLLVVFVALFLIERFLFLLHHHDGHDGKHHHGSKAAVPMVIFGDTVHNFLDGVAIAAAFVVEPALGLIVAMATFLHETPHEVADFGILLSAGWTRQKAFFVNFLSALATFPGAFLTYYFAHRVESSVGILLAIAAGLFLYVAATDFLPETRHEPSKNSYRNVLYMVLGILVITIFGFIAHELGH